MAVLLVLVKLIFSLKARGRTVAFVVALTFAILMNVSAYTTLADVKRAKAHRGGVMLLQG